MEAWLKKNQDKVWTSRKTSQLEKHWHNNPVHDALIKSAASLVKGNTLLDVGCGLGHLYKETKKINPRINYVGIDQSHDMITRARELHPEAFFHQQNLYEMEPHQFDTVTCLEVLHHQPDLEPAFSLLTKRSKEILIISLWIHERYQGGRRSKKYVGSSGEIVHFYSEAELENKFSEMDYDVYKGIGHHWRYVYCFNMVRSK